MRRSNNPEKASPKSKRPKLQSASTHLKKQIIAEIPSRKVFESPVAIKGDFNLFESLESVFPLMEFVFEFLDFKNLQTVLKVKKSWKTAAENVMKKRNQLSWMSIVYEAKFVDRIIHDENFPWENVAVPLVFTTHRQMSADSKFCLVDSYRNIYTDYALPNLLKDELFGKDLDLAVMEFGALLHMNFNEKSSKKCPKLNGCFLPLIPNVTVKIRYTYITDEMPRASVEEPSEELRAVLLFSDCDLEDDLYQIVNQYVPVKNHREVAVSGGIARNISLIPKTRHPKKGNSGYTTCCINFYEKSNCKSEFDAYSFVIDDDNKSLEDYERKLVDIRRKINLRKQSVAFKMTCCAIKNRVEELASFAKVFSNIPTFGMFVDGEIGWMSENIEQTPAVATTRVRREAYSNLRHQYSSTVLVLTWGSKLEDH